jgi:phosphoglycolate phosphatase-like HAD superfamily hydrolase
MKNKDSPADLMNMIDGALQAVVFDFDGVLVESVGLKTEAFAALYEAEGPKIAADVRKYHLMHGGMSRYAKFRYYEEVLLKRPPPNAERMAELDGRFSDLVEDKVIDASAVAGAQDLLNLLHGRLPLHVISATPEAELLRIVRGRGWQEFFYLVLGSPRTKQDSLRMALTYGSYEPNKVLMIGDAMSDFEAAASCGTRFLACVPPESSNPFPTGTAYVHDMTPIVALFRSLGIARQT